MPRPEDDENERLIEEGNKRMLEALEQFERERNEKDIKRHQDAEKRIAEQKERDKKRGGGRGPRRRR